MNQNYPQPKNRFATDAAGNPVGQGDPLLAGLTPAQKQKLLEQLLKEPTGKEIDLNKPVIVMPPPGGWPKLPAMVYDHESGQMLQANDERELKAALKRGFQATPSVDFDYSKLYKVKMQNGEFLSGFGKKKDAVVRADDGLTAAELAELDEAADKEA